MEERSANPMNRLVPYLDLFERLSDAELARLAVVGPDIVAGLRKQVVAVCHTLERYVDLLGRLPDEDLVRLTGASAKTVRFWRLCQPRTGRAVETPTPAPAVPPARGEEPGVARAVRSRAETAPHPVVDRADDTTQPRSTQPMRPTPPPQTSEQPRNSGTGTHQQIDINGTPFPGFDYDAREPVPDELEVQLPELGDV
jgi:hypothetical protein